MSPGSCFQAAGALTRTEIARYSYFHFLYRHRWLALFVGSMFVLSLVGLTSIALSGDPGKMKNPGMWYFLLLVWIVLISTSSFWSARRQGRKQKALNQPIQYYFGEERIRQDGTGFAAELAWSLVHEVYETKTLVAIYHTPEVAWVLPKRFFSGGHDEFELWREFAQVRLAKSEKYRKPGRVARFF